MHRMLLILAILPSLASPPVLWQADGPPGGVVIPCPACAQAACATAPGPACCLAEPAQRAAVHRHDGRGACCPECPESGDRGCPCKQSAEPPPALPVPGALSLDACLPTGQLRLTDEGMIGRNILPPLPPPRIA